MFKGLFCANSGLSISLLWYCQCGFGCRERVKLRQHYQTGQYFGRIEEFHADTQSWECYVERYEQFFAATDITDRKKMVAVFLASVGGKVYSELRDLVTPTKPSELSFDEIKEKLQARYCPQSTTILHRYQFHNLKQQSESVSEFLSALRRKTAKM